MQTPPPAWYAGTLNALIDRHDLEAGRMEQLLEAMLSDLLGELGVALVADPAFARRCLDEAGMAFCLAPHFHPAVARVGPLRRRLGVRTLFNCLGPLVNPARAPFQLLGVGRPEWLEPLA